MGFTWKVFTLDLRYYDTDLSKGDCNAFTSDPTAEACGFSDLLDSRGERDQRRPVLQLVRCFLRRQAVGRPDARQPEISKA